MPEITVDELESLIAEGAHLLDVREADEVAGGTKAWLAAGKPFATGPA